jgi:hypothetical protein
MNDVIEPMEPLQPLTMKATVEAVAAPGAKGVQNVSEAALQMPPALFSNSFVCVLSLELRSQWHQNQNVDR